MNGFCYRIVLQNETEMIRIVVAEWSRLVSGAPENRRFYRKLSIDNWGLLDTQGVTGSIPVPAKSDLPDPFPSQCVLFSLAAAADLL